MHAKKGDTTPVAGRFSGGCTEGKIKEVPKGMKAACEGMFCKMSVKLPKHDGKPKDDEKVCQTNMRCNIVKWTSCRESVCSVKKTVQCEQICNEIGARHGDKKEQDCRKDLCEGYFTDEGQKVSAQEMDALKIKLSKTAPRRQQALAAAYIAMLARNSIGAAACRQVAMMA